MHDWLSKALVLALLGTAPAAAQQTDGTVYSGAHVWTGSAWQIRDVAVSGNRMVAPETIGARAARVDLRGKWIVPAFANAHAHITNATEQASRFYTDAGLFYVWNPNTITLGPAARAFYVRPDTYDVKVAQGGITEPGSHPEPLYVETLAKYVYRGRTRDWFVGNAFHYGATPAQIDAALDEQQRQGAQLIKAYLLGSERYGSGASAAPGARGRGLDPRNLAYLVARAHQRGLPVAVHVETVHDLRMAAWAGADVAAHAPGYNARTADDRFRIGAADARLIARAGMAVVPTYVVIRGEAYAEGQRAPKPEARPVLDLQVANIRALRDAGVELWMGTDGDGTIWPEAEHLVEIGALTAAQAAERVFATGAALFPERRIGCFAAGCEADFLVLGGDPTIDVRALRTIERRIMQGRELPSPVPVVSPTASD